MSESVYESAGKGKGWLRLKAAADALGVSVHTLRRWADSGVVPSYRSPGGQRRFRRADLERQLAAMARAGGDGRAAPAAPRPAGRRQAPLLPASRTGSEGLTSLLASSHAVASAESLDAALHIVAERAARALGSASCVIYEYDEDHAAVIPRALYEREPSGYDRLGESVPLTEFGVARRAFDAGEWVVERLSDPDLDPESRRSLELWNETMSLVIPLRLRDESKGILAFFEQGAERDYTHEEFALLGGLAEMAAAAIDSAQLMRRLEGRNRRLAALVDSGSAIASTLVLEDVLNEVAAQAAKALGCPQCLITEYVEADGFFERAYYTEDPDDAFAPGGFVPRAEDPMGQVIIEGRVVVQESLSDPDLHPESRRTMEFWGEKTCLSVPLLYRDDPVGMLVLIEVAAEREFTPEERELAAALGRQASSAIHAAKQIQLLRVQTKHLSSLLDASRATTSSLVPSEVLSKVVHSAADALGSPTCLIWEYVAETDELLERAFIGDPDSTDRWPLQEHPAERSVLLGGEILVETISDPDLDAVSRTVMEGFGEKTALTAPMRFGDETLGLLQVVETARERVFTAQELELARGLADQAAVAMHNARLYEDLERRNAELAAHARRERLVSEASLKFTASLGLEDVRVAAAQHLTAVLGVDGCDIYALNADGDGTVCVTSWGSGGLDHDYMGRRFPLSDWVTDRLAVETRRPIVVSSLDDPQLPPIERASMEEYGETATLMIPLVAKGRVIGIIGLVATDEGHVFSPEDIELATSLSGIAALAIDNTDLYREQEEQTRRLASLLDVSRAIATSVGGRELFANLARKASEALGCPECVIYEYDAAADTITGQALYQAKPTGHNLVGVAHALDEWPADRAILESREIVVETLSDPSMDAKNREAMIANGEKSCINLPLSFGAEPLGILVLIETEREREFTRADLELARVLSEQASVAMHNKRLFERLEQRGHEGALLNDIARQTATSLELPDIAAATLEELRRLTRFERATLVTLSPESGLEVVYSTEQRSPFHGITLEQFTPGFVERLQADKVLFLDLPADLPLPQGYAAFDDLASAAIIALYEEGAVVGALVLGSTVARAFGASERRVLEGVGAHLSLAVKNARLYESIKQLHVGGLRALSSALNAKDYYTLGHTARVATYAGLLAREIGWPQQVVERVEEVAYLHDIGKISVSDRILLKPSRLSEDDWLLMREHPAVSAEILQPLLEERYVAGVRHHHEHYDGTGYPDGLAGQDIPELARLLTVVDSYDAMSSRRLYRPPFTYLDCVAELQRCRGIQFDPDMVDAFLRVLERLWAVREVAVQAADAAAERIDGDMHMLLRQTGDERRPEYTQIAETLRGVRDTFAGIPSMSTEIRLDEHRVMVVVDSEDDPERHVPLGETSLSDEEQVQAFAGHRLESNVVYVDAHGAWVSGIAPLRNSAGRVVALVSADVPAMAATGPPGDVAQAFASMVQNAASRLTRIEIDAMTDFLSGLYNHRYFQDRLREEVRSTLDEAGEMSLLFCDMDKFKEYNDQFGHTAGDAALRTVAQIIDGSIRTNDVAARYGGDEFAVILVGRGAKIALEVAERIRAGVAQANLEVAGGRVSVSIGVATLPQDAETQEQLVERADWAMYLAKHRGRDQVVRFRIGETAETAAHSFAAADGIAKPGPAALQFMGTMAGLADRRQLYAERHSDAVAKLARTVAGGLGLPAVELAAIEEAARLRDIGQFAVLEEVLSKPSRLTDEEWIMVRQHPEVGERLLRALNADDAVADAVASHHERFDGAGYPAGLAGDQIPITARIIAAACAYEAMVVPRPYREALSEAEALEELVRGSGSQFDPDVVACLERILTEK